MKRHFLIISLMLAVACTVGAKPRTAAQLRQEAAKALSTTSMAKGMRSNAPATLKVGAARTTDSSTSPTSTDIPADRTW